ncbi:hypothetical protein MSAN_00215500 [Mycena sanguinolenta]|uniref:Uncharacterized protein n=1 Tax=Mycena sanguinolenta TaxID=230812 RepID=A0A8H6ZIC1_9AGAR|nr:hypothetical protein MSAN_00215500 [Mycena sanguinolenta]
MVLLRYLVLMEYLVLSALAQGIRIAAPANGMIVSAESELTVEVQKLNSIASSIEVAIVIGFLNCGFPAPSPSPMDEVGAVLFNGPYHPTLHNGVGYQNFTVVIPEFALPGSAQLSVVHFNLIGVASLV